MVDALDPINSRVSLPFFRTIDGELLRLSGL